MEAEKANKLEKVFDSDDTWSLVDGKKTVLSVTETEEDNRVVVALKGSLPSATEQPLRDELNALTSVGAEIVLDCKELTAITYACQMMLVTLQQRMDSYGKGGLVIRNLPKKIYDDFKKDNLHELLEIER